MTLKTWSLKVSSVRLIWCSSVYTYGDKTSRDYKDTKRKKRNDANVNQLQCIMEPSISMKSCGEQFSLHPSLEYWQHLRRRDVGGSAFQVRADATWKHRPPTVKRRTAGASSEWLAVKNECLPQDRCHWLGMKELFYVYKLEFDPQCDRQPVHVAQEVILLTQQQYSSWSAICRATRPTGTTPVIPQATARLTRWTIDAYRSRIKMPKQLQTLWDVVVQGKDRAHVDFEVLRAAGGRDKIITNSQTWPQHLMLLPIQMTPQTFMLAVFNLSHLPRIHHATVLTD